MPQLEAKEYAEIALIIDELADVVDDLNESPRNFVSDQIERKKQYGERMFLSPKQINWLRNLHNEHVGTAEQPGPKGVDGRSSDPRSDEDMEAGSGQNRESRGRSARRKSDMDDDIPF